MVKFLKYKSNEEGQVAVIFSLALLPVIALTSAAVDYSEFTKQRNRVSSALDVAVLAAANNNAIPNSEKDAYARTHFFENYSGDVKVNLTSEVTDDRVRLVANGTLDLTFGNVVGIQDLNLVETSAASLRQLETICVLSLSEDADEAISFDDVAFKASQCTVQSNSKSSSAIYARTRTIKDPIANSFCAVGGANGNFNPHARGECSPVADPYESVPPAEIGVCKSEFLVENTSLADNATEAEDLPRGRGRSRAELQNLLPPTLHTDFFTPPHLPGEPPFSVDFVTDEIERRHESEGLGAEGLTSEELEVAVEQVRSLTTNDFQRLLAAYESFGGEFACLEQPNDSCFGFNNIYLNTPATDVPSFGLVSDVFDILYSYYLEEDEGGEADVPDIVTNGIVELINGELFSRNNLDNELVPVSSNLSGGNIVLTPGTYCGGLTVDGISVRFTAGDYIFKDGPLTFLNESQAKADQVTFGFTGAGATLNIESGSSLEIRSATTGPRSGLAFMQMVDSSAPGNRQAVEGVNRIASGGSISMSGTAYFPQQSLMISGENTRLGANSPAVGLIADTIAFRGETGSSIEIGVDHVKAGIPPIQPLSDDGVRLVE